MTWIRPQEQCKGMCEWSILSGWHCWLGHPNQPVLYFHQLWNAFLSILLPPSWLTWIVIRAFLESQWIKHQQTLPITFQINRGRRLSRNAHVPCIIVSPYISQWEEGLGQRTTSLYPIAQWLMLYVKSTHKLTSSSHTHKMLIKY